MAIRIAVKRLKGVYRAIAYDSKGEQIDSLVAFTERSARQLLKEKLGIAKKKEPKTQRTKKQRASTKKNSKSGTIKSRSILTGLQGVTSARSWKKTK